MKSYKENAYKIPILYVDDEENILEIFKFFFDDKFKIHTALSAEKGLEILKQNEKIGVVITDERMPGMSGIEFLEKVVNDWPDTVRIIISAYSDAPRLLKAINTGHAQEYIIKPFSETDEDVKNLETILKNALFMVSNRRHLRKKANLADALQKDFKEENYPEKIVGAKTGLKEVVSLAKKFSKSDATIHIYGETGTGKEVISRFIHESSNRNNKPYIKVNCASIAESLLESELFGHEKGAFTGAVKQKKGRFELADTGTIFLDEIGDISSALQLSLLRILQEKEFERVGGTKTVKTDVRIISATNRNLEELVKKGKFREDLYYRLNVLKIELPPLRVRKDDIELFINHFIKKYKVQYNLNRVLVKSDVISYLQSYHWPGNVRELENIIQRTLAMTEDGTISLKEVSFGPQKSSTFRDQIIKDEESRIKEAMVEANGNVTKAAKILGMPRSTFRFKAKKLGLY